MMNCKNKNQAMKKNKMIYHPPSRNWWRSKQKRSFKNGNFKQTINQTSVLIAKIKAGNN